jgi:hypothetical protein
MDIKHMVVPGIALGVALGIIGAVPFVNLCNICCLWIIFGGFAAAYLYARKTEVELADAAVIGVIFGFVYGITVNVAGFLVTTLLSLLGVGAGGLAREPTGFFGVRMGGPLRSVTLAFFNILLGMVFGATGGVLYTITAGREKEGDVV